jgi:hypothetical protein
VISAFSIKKEDDYYRRHLNNKYQYTYSGSKLVVMKDDDVSSKFTIGSGDDILRNMMSNYKRTRTLLNTFKTRKKAGSANIAGLSQKNNGAMGIKRQEGSGIEVGIVNNLRSRILNERSIRHQELIDQKNKKKLKEEEEIAAEKNAKALAEQEK